MNRSFTSWKHLSFSFWRRPLVAGLLLPSLLLAFAASARATDWYVDPAATGTNAGTSWANAWTHIGAIATGTLRAGDVVYFSGGPSGSSQSYTIDANSTYPGQWLCLVNGVTYKIGQDSAHNGTAIFDNLSASICISLVGKNGVTFSGDAGDGAMHFRFLVYNLGVQADNSYNCRISYCDFPKGRTGISWNPCGDGTWEVDHCNFYITATNANNAFVGIFQAKSYDQIKIHHNTISIPYDPARVGWGADAMVLGGFPVGNPSFSTENGGFSVYNNIIVGRPDTTFTGGQHQDGWQSQGAAYVKFYNNLFVDIQNYAMFPEGNTSSAVNGFGFKHCRYYNNIAVLTSRHATQAIAISGVSTVGTDGQARLLVDVVCANNIAVNYGGIAFSFDYYDHVSQDAAAFTDCHFSNNIAVNCTTGWHLDNAVLAANNVSLTNAQAATTFVSYAAGSASNDYHLRASATPLIATGVNLSSVFAVDKDNLARPSAGSWDIGPYISGAGIVVAPSNALTAIVVR